MPLPPTINDPSVTLTFGAAGVYYGYCTVADVAYEFPNKASFSTLTNSAIAQEITFAAQEAQVQLDHVYQMPYTGTDAGILLRLRMINAKLATANLIERYFSGSEPDLSPAGTERRSWAELNIMDVINGVEHWEYPFGDATPRAQLTVYQQSAGATITPDPNDIDPNNAYPIFSIGTTRFRSDMM
jgi:hypothetical protein